MANKTINSGDLQSQLNATSAGDVITLGSFNTGSNAITFPPNRTYQNGTITGTSSAGWSSYINGDGVSLLNMTFNNGGLKLDKPSGHNDSITIKNCTFNLNCSGQENNCITATSGLSNSTVTNNLFTGYSGQYAIYGYNWSKSTIQWNECVNITAGMHVASFGGDAGNMNVSNNYFVGVKGMGLEWQGGATNMTFDGNWYEAPNLSTNFATNNNSMAFSLPLDASVNITIKNNVCITTNKADGTGTRIAIECGGQNCNISNNYISTTNATIACTDGNGNCSVTAQNNKVVAGNPTTLQRANGPASDLKDINNGPNVVLDIDLIARGHPKRDGTYAGNGGTTMALTLTGTVDTTNTKTGTIKYAVSNAPTGAASILILVRATGDKTIMNPLVGPTIVRKLSEFPLSISDYHTGWGADVRAIALDASGEIISGGATEWQSFTLPGVSTTTPWPPVTSTTVTVADPVVSATVITKGGTSYSLKVA